MDFYGRYFRLNENYLKRVNIIKRTINRYLTKLFGSVRKQSSTFAIDKRKDLLQQRAQGINLCAQFIIHSQ